MTEHDDRASLRHMLDHAEEAIARVRGRTREDLAADRTLYLTVIALMEIIGEAARRVSEETRRAHPEIRWRDVVGLRSRLVHAYDRVDLDIVWDAVMIHLPTLASQVRRALARMRDDR